LAWGLNGPAHPGHRGRTEYRGSLPSSGCYRAKRWRIRWWQRFGFDPFNTDDAGNLDRYLLTKDIAATLDGL
jgi:hypothetical protein